MPRMLILAGLLAAVAGCREPVTAPPSKPPKVTVALPVQKDVALYLEFRGRTAAFKKAEIRARVQGFLETVKFQDADDVTEEQLLFVIEKDPFQATLDQANAELAAAQAARKLAEANLARGLKLIEKRAISQQDIDVFEAEVGQSKAAIDAAQARIDQAALQLKYTDVTSPIAGRIDRKLVDVGNLVGASEKTLLATVLTLDPIYAYFDIDERTLLRIRREYGGRRQNGNEREHPPGTLATGESDDFKFQGKLDYIDNRVDANTGTVQVRGEFDNKDLTLLPGMDVKLRVPRKTRPNSLLVEEQAIGTDMTGKYVLVLGNDNLVEQKRITLGPSEGRFRVVESGLTPEDKYIVEGIQRARPGLPVEPEMRTSAEPAGDAEEAEEAK